MLDSVLAFLSSGRICLLYNKNDFVVLCPHWTSYIGYENKHRQKYGCLRGDKVLFIRHSDWQYCRMPCLFTHIQGCDMWYCHWIASFRIMHVDVGLIDKSPKNDLVVTNEKYKIEWEILSFIILFSTCINVDEADDSVYCAAGKHSTSSTSPDQVIQLFYGKNTQKV